MHIKELVGSGDRIAAVTLPVVALGVALEIANLGPFAVGLPMALRWLSLGVLAAGTAIWAWSVVLMLVNVPRHRLILRGPYAWVRYPLYTSVALLVLPSAGLLLGSWARPRLGHRAVPRGSAVRAGGGRRAVPEVRFGLGRLRRSVRLSWL